MNIGAGSSIDNPLDMLEYLVYTSAKDYSAHKRDFMLYGIVCGWEGVSHDKYPLDEECANELDKMHEQYEALKKMLDDGVKPVVHGHWIKHDYAEESEGLLIPNYECSVCHSWLRDYRHYCGDCGSRMDEKDGENDG